MITKCLPHYAAGIVVKGFGRGSKELGCPTGECLQFVYHFQPNFYTYIMPLNFGVIVPIIQTFRLPNCSTIILFFDVANFSLEVVRSLPREIITGIYYGWASVDNGEVYKMVMSIGMNPFYDNKERSMV